MQANPVMIDIAIQCEMIGGYEMIDVATQHDIVVDDESNGDTSSINDERDDSDDEYESSFSFSLESDCSTDNSNGRYMKFTSYYNYVLFSTKFIAVRKVTVPRRKSTLCVIHSCYCCSLTVQPVTINLIFPKQS